MNLPSIAIDAFSARFFNGPGTYLYGMLKQNIPCNDVRWIILGDDAALTRKRLAGLVQQPNVEFVNPVNGVARSFDEWRTAVESYVLMRSPNVFYSPVFYLPKTKAAAKTAVTIHDTHFVTRPNDWSGKEDARLFILKAAYHACTTADLVVCPSQQVATDITDHLGVTPKRIQIYHPGVAPSFTVRSPDEIRNLRIKYALPKEYLISVLGIYTPRKNIFGLLMGHCILQKRLSRSIRLVCISKGLNHYIERLDWLPQDIDIIEQVADDEMPIILSGASTAVCPSFAECFGLPARESLACGTRVVAANLPVYKDFAVQDSSIIYVDPADAFDIAKGMQIAIEMQANGLRPNPQDQLHETIPDVSRETFHTSLVGLAAQ